MNKPTQTSIFVIPATDAPIAAILRRGPSKHVLLLKWNLKTDQIETGQWFKGRIYERRCDLSPCGKYFLYFAAKYKMPLRSWTAISKLPYLKALALWPKGDGWGGGGSFADENTIKLNHRSDQFNLQAGTWLKPSMKATPISAYAGGGEDFPVYHDILQRQQWKLISEGVCDSPNWGGDVTWLYTEPMIFEKNFTNDYRLQMCFKGVSQKNDQWYWIDYNVVNHRDERLFSLPRTDWADWDKNGDLLFTQAGKIYRLSHAHVNATFTLESEYLKLVADLTSLKFEPIIAPEEASKW